MSHDTFDRWMGLPSAPAPAPDPQRPASDDGRIRAAAELVVERFDWRNIGAGFAIHRPQASALNALRVALAAPAPGSPKPGDDGTQAVIDAATKWAEVETLGPPSILVAAGRYPSKTAAKRDIRRRRRVVARRLLNALAALKSGRAALGEDR